MESLFETLSACKQITCQAPPSRFGVSQLEKALAVANDLQIDCLLYQIENLCFGWYARCYGVPDLTEQSLLGTVAICVPENASEFRECFHNET